MGDGIQMVRTHQLKKTLTEENVITKTNKVRKIKYVFIEFDSEETCEEAKVALEKNCDLFVDYVGIKSTVGKRDKSEKEIIPTRLFLTGLPKGMTDELLKQIFPKSIDAKIPSRSIKKGGFYGFVEFNNAADATRAFDVANNAILERTLLPKGVKHPHHITVQFATKRIKPKRKKKIISKINPTQLFVAGLPEGTNNEMLKSIFPKAKNVNTTGIRGRKVGFHGIVEFINTADAKAALDAANDLALRKSILPKDRTQGKPITVQLAASRTLVAAKTGEN